MYFVHCAFKVSSLIHKAFHHYYMFISQKVNLKSYQKSPIGG